MNSILHATQKRGSKFPFSKTKSAKTTHTLSRHQYSLFSFSFWVILQKEGRKEWNSQLWIWRRTCPTPGRRTHESPPCAARWAACWGRRVHCWWRTRDAASKTTIASSTWWRGTSPPPTTSNSSTRGPTCISRYKVPFFTLSTFWAGLCYAAYSIFPFSVCFLFLKKKIGVNK